MLLRVITCRRVCGRLCARRSNLSNRRQNGFGLAKWAHTLGRTIHSLVRSPDAGWVGGVGGSSQTVCL